MKTPEFVYSAVDSAGETRKGVIAAVDRTAAYRAVRALGFTPTGLRSRWVRLDWSSRGDVTRADVANLTRELSVLVEARIPLARGLASIAENETKPALRALLTTIAERIASGTRISEAIAPHVNVFGEVYIESMRAAEQTGSLDAVTTHLADMLERQIESQQALRRALTYPAVVLGVVVLALTVILMFVVPQFAKTFAASDLQLPMVTRVIQAIGMQMRENWWAVLLAGGGAIVGGKLLLASRFGREMLEQVMIRVPVMHGVVVAVTTARFTRVLGIALGSGLSVIDSIELAGRSTGRPIFVAECELAAQRLRGGEAMASALHGTSYLPRFAERLLGAGKDSHEVERACAVVSRHYERIASHTVQNLHTIIEPLLTVFLAGIVLLVALSVMLPMWQMASSAH